VNEVTFEVEKTPKGNAAVNVKKHNTFLHNKNSPEYLGLFCFGTKI